MACGQPASPDQSLPTEITSSGSSPVQIEICNAALIDKPGPGGLLVSELTKKRNYYIAAAVDFRNISPHALNAVRFVFDVHDTFDATTETLGLDWLGTFAPNVVIHARSNLAGTVGAVAQQNTSGSATTVVCHVEFARFSDGRVWKWGDRSAPVTPGLYYPPTSSPTESP